MRFQSMWAVVALIIMSQDALLAKEPKQLVLKWNELESRIGGRKVALELPGGTRIEGKALRVDANGLRMKVRKTSDRKVQPKGEHAIPRQSISGLRMTEYRVIGRLIGALAPPAVVGIITPALASEIYEGPLVIIVPALAVAGAIGLSVAGYYIGKALDKRVVEIQIAPEN